MSSSPALKTAKQDRREELETLQMEVQGRVGPGEATRKTSSEAASVQEKSHLQVSLDSVPLH